MRREKIDIEVKNIHREIWDNKEILWPNQQVTPIQMLEPAVVAHVLGLEYIELPDLGNQRFGFKGQKFKVAGLLDRQANKIAVSRAFADTTVRFTGLHEAGHWLLHPNQVMHRDRPIDGSSSTSVKRPQMEKEADYFAAAFLIPANLLADRFKEQFQTNLPFVFNDINCFYLDPNDSGSLLNASSDSLTREFALAKCTSFNGNYFRSLAEQFRVSNSAMAIRIKELNLVRWP